MEVMFEGVLSHVNKVRRQATLMKMADKVEQACEELGITVDDDTLVAVATTLSVDGGTLFQDALPTERR